MLWAVILPIRTKLYPILATSLDWIIWQRIGEWSQDGFDIVLSHILVLLMILLPTTLRRHSMVFSFIINSQELCMLCTSIVMPAIVMSKHISSILVCVPWKIMKLVFFIFNECFFKFKPSRNANIVYSFQIILFKKQTSAIDKATNGIIVGN